MFGYVVNISNVDTPNLERSTKIVTFSGNDNEWREWKEKFLAQACLLGYRDLLDENIKLRPEGRKSLTDDEAFA